MTNRTTFSVLLILLVISLIANYLAYSDNKSIQEELFKSKGRVEVYEKEIAKSDSILKNLKKALKEDSIKIAQTKDNIKIVEKWYAVEKTRVSKLPPDSAVAFIKRRLNRK